MVELSIGQVARQAGVRTSKIRYYESINILPPPRRSGGQRRYDPAVLERLAFIQAAQRLGFTLAEIALLFQTREEETPLAERWQLLASRKLTEVDRLIRQAASMRRLLARGLRCGCPTLHECIHCILQECDRQ
jgi:MerR family transcriptional regulator, redox-sensitive transcriptional activator SoxR